ncbi:hypothetical protein GH714_021619 [Hevea brasiliensis]|uniref:Uncharacterized protein n=1 Tax=Hevea brasiliensis TaxID=3981 RepID=A0A6A6LZF1_HEVBR|nr:hypothetical protein GH714_021619 [Hevea brasiliensis]
MLKETLKWRLEFKPEKIRWEDVTHEAQTGKVYKANYSDKKGRTVLVMTWFSAGFDYEAYGQRMREEEKKVSDSNISGPSSPVLSVTMESQQSGSLAAAGRASDEDDSSSVDEATSNLEGLDEETQDQPSNCENVQMMMQQKW